MLYDECSKKEKIKVVDESEKISNIIIGCDHAAFTLKEKIKLFLKGCNVLVTDTGVYNKSSIDYPDIGFEVALQISKGIFKLGILICGTGIGMSMVANRFPYVRAALCNDILSAEMSKRHNNSNILVMGARIISEELAVKIINTWLNTRFEKGRHQRRLNKFDSIKNLFFL